MSEPIRESYARIYLAEKLPSIIIIWLRELALCGGLQLSGSRLRVLFLVYVNFEGCSGLSCIWDIDMWSQLDEGSGLLGGKSIRKSKVAAEQEAENASASHRTHVCIGQNIVIEEYAGFSGRYVSRSITLSRR